MQDVPNIGVPTGKPIAHGGDLGEVRRRHPTAPQPWIAEVTDAKYTLSDMMNKIINENMAIEAAQDWAQKELLASHQKFVKR